MYWLVKVSDLILNYSLLQLRMSANPPPPTPPTLTPPTHTPPNSHPTRPPNPAPLASGFSLSITPRTSDTAMLISSITFCGSLSLYSSRDFSAAKQAARKKGDSCQHSWTAHAHWPSRAHPPIVQNP